MTLFARLAAHQRCTLSYTLSEMRFLDLVACLIMVEILYGPLMAMMPMHIKYAVNWIMTSKYTLFADIMHGSVVLI